MTDAAKDKGLQHSSVQDELSKPPRSQWRDIWDQFSEWLEQQVATATSANFVWTGQRAEWLAGQVAEHFAADGDAVLPALRTGRVGESGNVQRLERPEHERMSFGQKLYVGARGGYGGMLMIGLATTLAGMALLNPLSIGAGLLFGVLFEWTGNLIAPATAHVVVNGLNLRWMAERAGRPG